MTVHADIARIASASAAGIACLRRGGRGRSVPLLLLHGIGSNAYSFAPLMEALPNSMDIVAWHAPGYGSSPPLSAARPTPADYGLALARMLDALGLARIALAGHSLGCLFAARFAAQHPERVQALALLSPALGYRVAPGAALPPALQKRIDEIESLGPAAFAEKRAPRLVYEPERKPQVLAAVREAMGAVNPAGYVQAVHALGAGDLLADAARIAAPAIVAVGAQDQVTPPANARAAYGALARPAGYYEIESAGHALPQENPAAVARLLAHFIEVNNV